MSPQIEVSTDLYVALHGLMMPDDRTLADVIWRLAQEHQVRRTDRPARETGWSIYRTEGLHSGGTTIPDGLRLRGRHGGSDFVYAEVTDGRIVVNGEMFESPSRAALHAARALGSAAHSLNGWRWWEFEYPRGSDSWRALHTLRHPWQIERRRSWSRRY